jgi:hypothetical protein
LQHPQSFEEFVDHGIQTFFNLQVCKIVAEDLEFRPLNVYLDCSSLLNVGSLDDLDPC